MTGGGGGEVQAATDVLEERMIDAEYKIWKKNTPFLYNMVMTHSLEWPSLACQWLPNKRKLGKDAEEHSLLIGTHTTGEQNYLMVATAIVPNQDDVVVQDDDDDDADDNDAGKKPAAAAASKRQATGKQQQQKQPAPQYDEEKKEIGGFGHANTNVGKIEIKMKIKHEGEVNRARYMPQNHFIVATRGPNPEIYIFDRSKHPSMPSDNSPFAPQGVCLGHKKEGYGMVWSHHKEGMLCTGSEDKTVKLWDISHALGSKVEPGTQIHPLASLENHSETVEDVDWHYKDANMITSVGDDRRINIWDIRNPTLRMNAVDMAHERDINTVAFNPFNEFILATGSSDRTVAVWDMRNLSRRLQTLQNGHTDEVYMIQWSPHNESILGSCSADRRIAIWDLSRIGAEQTEEDAMDGPPELLFLHGGHTSKVSDFSWNPNADWTIASVAEDNVLQVWNMAEEIYAVDNDDDDEEQSSGEGEDGVLGNDELE